MSESAVLVLTSILSGQHLLVSATELELLCQISTETWSRLEDLEKLGISPDQVAAFVKLAILLVNQGEAESQAFLRIEEGLRRSHWPPCAAMFHLLNHFYESRVAPPGRVTSTLSRELDSEQRALNFLAKNGPPPPAFFRRLDALEIEDLPGEILESPLVEVLLRRRTERYFDPGWALPVTTLSHLLRVVLGAFGMRTLAREVQLLIKTSPSGGSLHPIEGYPLLMSVENRRAGFYHYLPERHSLELLKEMPASKCRELATYFCQGQTFVGTCAALVILVARFDRNFWKYQDRENSYSVVLQEAGHLSQTFQLVATDLGLGSFYTGAINSEAIVDLLQIPYPEEAPIGILGVGMSAPGPDLAARIMPFDPIAQR